MGKRGLKVNKPKRRNALLEKLTSQKGLLEKRLQKMNGTKKRCKFVGVLVGGCAHEARVRASSSCSEPRRSRCCTGGMRS